MRARLTTLRRDLSQSLAFLPACIVAGYFALGIGVVEFDRHLSDAQATYGFSGDAPAARTVLSVVAGSLITVAGLTFSITIVVLQLASSQFSPRILRSFFEDRVTQVTIGSFVGIFVYALLTLRAVGSLAGDDFVPRLGVAAATVLALGAVGLLVYFLHHVAQMIQVSHVVAGIAHDTLKRAEVLHPEPVGGPDAAPERDERLGRGRDQGGRPGLVHTARPGFVRRIDAHGLAAALAPTGAHRVEVVCRAGDFVGTEKPLAEVWPPGVADACAPHVRRAIVIGDERDLDDDVAFGLRQLTDIALKALSPAINDPATAVTCIGYLRSVLVRLAVHRPREDPPPPGVPVLIARRAFAEDLDVVRELARAAHDDPWVARELLRTLVACAAACRRAGAPVHLQDVLATAAYVAEHVLPSTTAADDVQALQALLAEVRGGMGSASGGGQAA